MASKNYSRYYEAYVLQLRPPGLLGPKSEPIDSHFGYHSNRPEDLGTPVNRKALGGVGKG